MTVLMTNVFEVEPGHVPEFLEAQRLNAAVQTRLGANRRVFRRMTGEGDDFFLEFSVVFEFADARAYGEFIEAQRADPEFRALTEARSAQTAADRTVRWVASYLSAEVEA